MASRCSTTELLPPEMGIIKLNGILSIENLNKVYTALQMYFYGIGSSNPFHDLALYIIDLNFKFSGLCDRYISFAQRNDVFIRKATFGNGGSWTAPRYDRWIGYFPKIKM